MSKNQTYAKLLLSQLLCHILNEINTNGNKITNLKNLTI